MNYYLSRLRRLLHYLGAKGSLTYLVPERLQLLLYWSLVPRRRNPGTYYLYAKDIPHPLLCRSGTTDRSVFWQIFIERHYEGVKFSHEPLVIIDCGAYVGYSTAYFLAHFTKAMVFAIEPDRQNFEVLMQNVSTYGRRVTILNSAVWYKATRLRLLSNENKWSTQVEEINEGEDSDMEGITIEDIIERYSLNHIDILKIDIEGAERQIFLENYQSWIDKVDTIFIELHGVDSKKNFHKALSTFPFRIIRSGEVTIAQRQY